MAGIGFSLQKILSKDSFSRTIGAYSVAGVISGGPWLLAILSLLFFSLLIPLLPAERTAFTQFLTTIAWIVAIGLIVSGSLAQAFSRYAADQLFLNQPTRIISNLNGLIFIATIINGSVAFLGALFLFPEQDILYRMLLVGSLVVFINVLIVVMLLTSLKDYKIILAMFFGAYLIIISMAYGLRHMGLDGFMLSFLIGQLILLFSMLAALYHDYPTNNIIEFHFLEPGNIYSILILSGFLLNLGVWIDKFVFWLDPATSFKVIGAFRASQFYDLPVFISYFCILPGMATFLLLMETKFSEYYEHFNEAIRSGKSLAYIRITGDQMVSYAYNVIHSMIKIQALVIIIVYLFGQKILSLLGLPNIYYNILYVVVMGASFQTILFSIVNILYYMDRRWFVLILSIFYLVTNTILTFVTLYLGPFFYGYGYTLTGAIACAVGLYFVNDEFTDLEYKVVMLREK